MLEKIFERKKDTLSPEQEKIAQRILFAFDSRQDFSQAKKVAEGVSDEKERQKFLDEIHNIEHGGASKFTEFLEKEDPPVSEIDFGDVMEAIDKGDIKDAEYLALEVSGETGRTRGLSSRLVKTDEYWGAKALLHVARAEFEKGKDPKKTIAKAKEVAWNIEDDPRRQVSVFADIVKLQSGCALFDDARKTAAEFKQTAVKPNWQEYNINTLAIIAQAEQGIGLSDAEIKNLDTATVDSVLRVYPELSSALNDLRINESAPHTPEKNEKS